MRDFGKTEKWILTEITRNARSGIIINFPSLIDPLFNDKAIKLDPKQKTARLEFIKGNDMTAAYETLEVERILMITLSLLTYLEKNGYVSSYDVLHDFWEMNRIPDGTEKVSYSIKSRELTDLLFKYFPRDILITEELFNFVNRGFLSNEDKRYNEQVLLAKKANRLAFLAVILSTFVALIAAIPDWFGIYNPSPPVKSQCCRECNEVLVNANINVTLNNNDLKSKNVKKTVKIKNLKRAYRCPCDTVEKNQ